MYLVVLSIKFYKNMDYWENQPFAVTPNKFYLDLHIYMLKIQCTGKVVNLLWSVFNYNFVMSVY